MMHRRRSELTWYPPAPAERLGAVSDRIEATTEYAALADCEAVLICVPTPLTANREPDLGPLESAADALGLVVQEGQLVVLESTTYPGTTREQVAPLLKQGSGLTVGAEINLAFSPERVDPGRTDYTLPEHGLASMPLDALLDSEPDAVVLVTAHPDVDVAAVVSRAPLLIDLRGRTRGLSGDSIVRL